MRAPSYPSETALAAAQSALDPVRWRRFFAVALGTAFGLCSAVYLFIAIIDPWDILPLSPSWQRAPMSTDQRFIYAALARNPHFDSLLLGTSTSRLLRPAALNAVLGGRFANLSMNSATPYEQSRLLDLFQQTHTQIGTVMVGIDLPWCETRVEKYFYRSELPEWMYRIDQWRNYAHVFNLYALAEALPQLGYLTGLRHARFGFDGYANFLPPDSRYDRVRAAANLPPPAPRGQVEDDLRDQPALRLPALEYLSAMLSGLPPTTRKIVFLAPIFLSARAPPGTPQAEPLSACKYRIAALARRVPGTTVVDFMIDSPITREPTNYWDQLHYRVAIAERLVADLAAAVKEPNVTSSDFRVLVP